MATRSPIRFILYLAYLGVLFLFGGLIYERLTRFEGYVYVEPQGFERVVVQPVGKGGRYLGSTRNMPIDVVPFSNPRKATRVFKDDTLYNAQFLPFVLRLDNLEVLDTFPDRDLLDLRLPQGPLETREIHLGEQVDVGGKPFTVAAIRPWAGLIRNGKGSPMAAVSIAAKDGGWTREFLLSRDVWNFPGENTFFLLRWHESEDAARADARSLPVSLAVGRWGVKDGLRTHWSTSLLPGAGFTLDDGTEATLVAHDPDIPEIVVALRKGEDTQVIRQRANAMEPGIVRFEAPARAAIAFVVYGWRDGKAFVQRLERDVSPVHEMEEGDAWQPEGGGGPIRLDQVMTTALPAMPATTGDEPVMEAVLQGEGGVVQLREGLYESLVENSLRYRREAVPPRVRYSLTARNREGVVGEITLSPGETKRIDAWVFSQDPRFARAGEGALLRARRTLGGPAQLAGMAMVIIGAFGWVVLRFYPHRAYPERPRLNTEIPNEPPAD